MSKIVVFLARENMFEQTYRAIESSGLSVDEVKVKVIKTSETVNETRDAVENGATIVIARGVQAQYIRDYTKTPLVEMVMTGQELSLLISKAKEMVKAKKQNSSELSTQKPKIAICGLTNMFSNTSYFGEIFDVDLRTYLVDKIDNLYEATQNAINDNVDILMGGDIVRSFVGESDVDYLFLELTEDSIIKALETANKMLYTAEIVRNHTADFEAVLDSTYQAIIKVDLEKNITVFNKISEELFNISSERALGHNIIDIIPELKEEYLESIFNNTRDIFNISIRIGSNPAMLSVLPIHDEKNVLGAIVTCYRLNIVNKQETSYLRSMHLKGFVTDSRFESVETKDKNIKACIELGKNYALSKNPVLIYGDVGTEKELFAQCIHNASVFKNGPFVSVNCAGMTEQRQIELLFGAGGNDIENIDSDTTKVKGALELSDGGTLFISEIEQLSLVCQYRLFRAIQFKSLIQTDLERTQALENRIIVSNVKRLEKAVEEGRFREDLYYLLNALVLKVPNIKEREDFVEKFIDEKISDFSKNYAKFLKISDSAVEKISKYNWNGNVVQLEAFCERLFLTTPQKTISSEYVDYLLNELYPSINNINQKGEVVVYKHPEAQSIQVLLEKYRGNRVKVAEEMQISTTTLWRKMKKYGVLDVE